MALSNDERTYYGGGFIVGVVLALLFGILAANAHSNQLAYIAAAVASGIAGVVGGIIFLVNN
jgi:hypothetical protein